MNKLILMFVTSTLISTEAIAHVCTPQQPLPEVSDPRPDASKRNKAVRVDTYIGNTRRNRSFNEFRNIYVRPNVHCVTKKVTDEYGYVEYFETCR